MKSSNNYRWMITPLMLLILGGMLFSGTLYVSINRGMNSQPGTKEKPLKTITKAISNAQPGDTIRVAGGVYSGTFGIGYLECDKPLMFYGSYSEDFSTRDMRTHPTLFQPDNQSGAKSRKPLLRLTGDVNGVVVDGFVFDMGMRNAYHSHDGKPDGVETGMLLLPPKKMSGQAATVTESCISIPSAAKGGDVLIQNNVFVNSAKFGIQAGVRQGTIKILNNVFVANRMAAIEVYGTCPGRIGRKAKPSCGGAEIAHNTILFSWSRTKDMKDMGYGIRIMTKLHYHIHHNLIGGSVLAGVDHTRFNNDGWIKLDHNVFFANKMADLEFSPASNTKLNLSVDQFGDLEFASCKGNLNEIPRTLTLDKKYLSGYLHARYSEQADYNSDSVANQWREAVGLNKQGTMRSRASMYGNRYPWQNAVKLFAAVEGKGAQSF